MRWNIDELIRQSLRQAARETVLSEEVKTEMLQNVLSELFRSKTKEEG